MGGGERGVRGVGVTRIGVDVLHGGVIGGEEREEKKERQDGPQTNVRG